MIIVMKNINVLVKLDKIWFNYRLQELSMLRALVFTTQHVFMMFWILEVNGQSIHYCLFTFQQKIGTFEEMS